jgi:hypothetical protein
MQAQVTRAAAALAGVSALLAIAAAVHGHLLRLGADAYLLAAACWLTVALVTFTAG